MLGMIRFFAFQTRPWNTSEIAVVIRQLPKFRRHRPVSAAFGEAAATRCVLKQLICLRHEVSPRRSGKPGLGWAVPASLRLPLNVLLRQSQKAGGKQLQRRLKPSQVCGSAATGTFFAGLRPGVRARYGHAAHRSGICGSLAQVITTLGSKMPTHRAARGGMMNGAD